MSRARKFNDLSGKRFGSLVVSHRVDNVNGNVTYRCICDCGNECDVRATNLTNGHTTSCGCIRKQSMRGVNLEDLTGQVFGRWTVLYRTESLVEPSGRKATMWHCRCECGEERDIRAHTLKNGTSKSCGCLKHDLLSIDRDLVGQVFGRWTVLRQGADTIYSGRPFRTWHCCCKCGTERDVIEQALIAGKSVSCGCYRKEQHKKSVTFEDLTGRVFGHWTVIKRADDRFYPGGGRTQMWLCQCTCGQEHVVAGNMLKSGISQSCGCMNEPRAESHVRKYFDDNNIKYEVQKTYSDLHGIGQGYLSYDFLVYHNDEPFVLIECQGEQHFRPVQYFGGEARFEIQQAHDKLKREYANSIDLPLIEIPYTCRTYDDISRVLSSLFQCVI